MSASLSTATPPPRLIADACPGCGRVYWRGTHAERMAKRMERMGI